MPSKQTVPGSNPGAITENGCCSCINRFFFRPTPTSLLPCIAYDYYLLLFLPLKKAIDKAADNLVYENILAYFYPQFLE